ncbi:hypothetical protein FHS55_000672 [Angulomicrobium tetraedrale]|uniref:Rhamnan synthesis protein F n=1 Tax=Ancylobacter tetraedralis TaxID=217068 RepID=A0A839Z6T9_9HYPH|nr:rhamnan synthesis F family protein [Ancylobacter tetraedralis]MBB3770086.1 hypothetical protein [Ancylobacter tetraedralis]
MDTPTSSRAGMAAAARDLPRIPHRAPKPRGPFRRWLTSRSQAFGRTLAKAIFDAANRPRWVVRKLVFDAYRRPRESFAPLVIRKDGRPRRAFAGWMADVDADLPPLVAHVHFPVPAELERPAAFVLCRHSAGEAMHLVEALAVDHDVIVLLVDPERPAPDMAAHLVPAAVTMSRVPSPVLLSALALQARGLAPRFAVAVGMDTADIALAFEARDIPVVFIADAESAPPVLEPLLRQATEVVFCSPTALAAADAAFPDFAGRDYRHIIKAPLGEGSARLAALGALAAGRVEREVALALTVGPERLEILDPENKGGDMAATLRAKVIAWRTRRTGGEKLFRDILRRPCSGFNPMIYAELNPVDCLANRRFPLAHWIERGQPEGPWSYGVVRPGEASPAAAALKVALHGHFFYVDLLPEMLERLTRNVARPDLFLTTDSDAKVTALRAITAGYPARVEIAVVPNLGRDIGPYFTALREPLLNGGYDVFFHVHGKKTKGRRRNIGDPWRTFLWENMIGGQHPMLDAILARFASDPTVGLAYPEDGHVLDWGRNAAIIAKLRADLDLGEPMTAYVDFPIGNMFAARPAALAPVLALKLDWSDYPPEPVPDDGTLLHALERILPLAVRKAGYRAVGVRVPGTDWED